jgi:hypothetical protein
MNKHINEFIAEDLTRLRDELEVLAFDAGIVKNHDLAVVVWKINSCLYSGYPNRTACKPQSNNISELKNEQTN